MDRGTNKRKCGSVGGEGDGGIGGCEGVREGGREGGIIIYLGGNEWVRERVMGRKGE